MWLTWNETKNGFIEKKYPVKWRSDVTNRANHDRHKYMDIYLQRWTFEYVSLFPN